MENQRLLKCIECNHGIVYDDVNLEKGMVKCKNCKSVFVYEAQMVRDEEFGEYQQEHLMFPPGIEVLKTSFDMEVIVNWRKSANNFLPFFALFWNGFLAFMAFPMIYGISDIGFGIVGLAPFFLVGLYLIYASLGYLLNRTYITLNPDQLVIEHKPISFLIQRNSYYLTKDIEQLYVRRYEVGKSNGTPVHAFALDVILKDGTKKELIKQLYAYKYARFIESEFERFMKIKDRPVEGEWGQKNRRRTY